jgi:hypothetical protein
MPTMRDLDAELDERLQRFAALGMSRAGMLAQLTLAGYPVELLRSRFPEFPDVAFGIGSPTTPAQDAATSRRVEARSPGNRPVRRTPASAQPPETPTRARATAAEEGIAFHYVPLIQC